MSWLRCLNQDMRSWFGCLRWNLWVRTSCQKVMSQVRYCVKDVLARQLLFNNLSFIKVVLFYTNHSVHHLVMSSTEEQLYYWKLMLYPEMLGWIVSYCYDLHLHILMQLESHLKIRYISCAFPKVHFCIIYHSISSKNVPYCSFQYQITRSVTIRTLCLL